MSHVDSKVFNRAVSFSDQLITDRSFELRTCVSTPVNVALNSGAILVLVVPDAAAIVFAHNFTDEFSDT